MIWRLVLLFLAVAVGSEPSTALPNEEQRASPKGKVVGLHTMFAGLTCQKHFLRQKQSIPVDSHLPATLCRAQDR